LLDESPRDPPASAERDDEVHQAEEEEEDEARGNLGDELAELDGDNHTQNDQHYEE
jgi:hypothetical protein